jgi:hypothetical protein
MTTFLCLSSILFDKVLEKQLTFHINLAKLICFENFLLDW